MGAGEHTGVLVQPVSGVTLIPMQTTEFAEDVEAVKKQALRLRQSARAYLAEVLIESLDEEDDYEFTEEQMAEVRRRSAEIDAGRATMIPGEEAIRRWRGQP